MPKKRLAPAKPVARDRNHEIDTEARRHLPLQFPAAWVLRDVLQDYGIDLEVEPFERGHSLGDLLLLQVKGFDGEVTPGQDHKFVMRTNGLRYAQRFIVPAVLVVQPLQGDRRARYLWLQEYVRVVLDYDKPKWRDQGRVTLHIPAGNVLEARLDYLRSLAAQPRRVEEMGQLARIAHEIAFTSDSFQFDPRPENALRLTALIDEALSLSSLFGAAGLPFTRGVLAQDLRVARTLVEKLAARLDWSPEDLPGVVADNLPASPEQRRWYLESVAQMRVSHLHTQLSATAATAMDHRLRRSVWLATGEHAF